MSEKIKKWEIELNQFGFTWGPARITRLTSCKRGVVIGLRTVGETVELVITPAGRVRIYDANRGRTMKLEAAR